MVTEVAKTNVTDNGEADLQKGEPMNDGIDIIDSVVETTSQQERLKQDDVEDEALCDGNFRMLLQECDGSSLSGEGCSLPLLLNHVKSLTCCVNVMGSMLEKEIRLRKDTVAEMNRLKCELTNVRTELQLSREWQRTAYCQLHSMRSQYEQYLRSITFMYEQIHNTNDKTSYFASHQSVSEPSSSQVMAEAMPYGDSASCKTICQRKRLKRSNSCSTQSDVKSDYDRKLSILADSNTPPVDNVKHSEEGAPVDNVKHGEEGVKCSLLEQEMELGNSGDHLKEDVHSAVENGNNSIEDTLRETAQSVVAESGFIYDESSGQYYDWKLKMYYDPSSQLYFDHENGVYYYYDTCKGSYIFHSQIQITNQHNKGDGGSQDILKANDDEPSDGEIVSDDEKVDSVPSEVVEHGSNTKSVQLCIRVIVVESEILDIGTLFVVTYKGGTIGSKETCTISIPSDDHVKDVHAYITYESHEKTFYIQDNETQHGTFINNERVSNSNLPSEAVEITHRDYIRVGSTAFSFHVHERETCFDCEPGNIQHILQQQQEFQDMINSQGNEQQRKQQNKHLRKKYGITPGYLPKSLLSSARDRASDRRKEHGIEAYHNIYAPVDKASILKEIPSHNKGHTMLQKMGWKCGEGLGKAGDGIITPIVVGKGEGDKQGLGVGIRSLIDDKDEIRSKNLQKTKERYAQCKKLP